MPSPWNQLLTSMNENFILPPPIEAKYRRGLVHPNPYLWTTRSDIDPVAMYLFRDPIAEAAVGNVKPYFAFAYTGHGLNSNTFVLNLVTRKVAIFLQFGVGPVYTQFVECRVAITRGFVMLARLLGNLPQGRGEIDYILAYSNIRGMELLERDPSKDGTESRLADQHIEGFTQVDFETVAASDGKGRSLDGQYFSWCEPMDFKLAASKFITSQMDGRQYS